MKKHFWKIEYSITIFVLFAVILFLLPSTFFPSREARYISQWNEMINKVDYMFIAMSAQAESDIVKGIKNAKSNDTREKYMIQLVRPYLRLHEITNPERKYHAHFMSGANVPKDNYYYFKNLYLSDDGEIIGIKDIKDNDSNHPGFMMLFDMNGFRGPNTWGKDIFGLDTYPDGRIKPLGYGENIDKLKFDCSVKGTGTSCSHYYRIGGEFNE